MLNFGTSKPGVMGLGSQGLPGSMSAWHELKGSHLGEVFAHKGFVFPLPESAKSLKFF